MRWVSPPLFCLWCTHRYYIFHQELDSTLDQIFWLGEVALASCETLQWRVFPPAFQLHLETPQLFQSHPRILPDGLWPSRWVHRGTVKVWFRCQNISSFRYALCTLWGNLSSCCLPLAKAHQLTLKCAFGCLGINIFWSIRLNYFFSKILQIFGSFLTTICNCWTVKSRAWIEGLLFCWFGMCRCLLGLYRFLWGRCAIH